MKQSVRLHAFTLIELLVIAASLLLLCLVIIPSAHRVKRARDERCRNNLRQIGLALKIWPASSPDDYPPQIPVKAGGAKELAEAGYVYFSFLIMSNELSGPSGPKVLVCPLDRHRTPATNFGSSLCDTNLSYFLGLDVPGDQLPQALMSGDRNLAFGGHPLPHSIFPLSTNMVLTWTKDLHDSCGNILFADGSVQFFEQAKLPIAIQQQGLATNRLAIP